MEYTNTHPRKRIKVVSIFEPHHATQILYPSRLLLKDGESQLLIAPRNMANRIEPHHIVPDDAVIFNKTSGNQALDTDFVTYTTTSLWPDDELASTGDIFADMQAVTQHIGTTKLRVVLFQDPLVATPGAPRKYMLRINRFSRLERIGGKVRYEKVEYNMSLEHFNEALRQIDLSRAARPTWTEDMVELLEMTSDRAVLHVRRRLLAVGLRMAEDRWRAPRMITTEAAIAHLATVMTKTELTEYNSTLPAEDHLTGCPCCMEEFDDPDTTDPIKLDCSKRHVLCFSCVKNICKTSGLAKVRCPWCAVLIANDSNSHVLQPNYLDLTAPFQNDVRYSKFENFERGCADLDSGHVRDDTTKILTSSPRLLFVWDLLIHTSPSPERRERLWRDHRCVPEYTIVRAAVFAFANGWNGESWSVNEVFKQLRHMIFYCLAVEWKKGEMCPYATDKLKQEVEQDHSKVPLRPGFVEFIDRSLNRLLRFMVVRRCEEDCGTLCGMHSHGERLFCKAYWATRQDDVFPVQVKIMRERRKARTWAQV